MTKWQKELVFYRLAKARRTLEDGITLCEKGSCISVVNRLYYAVFYAATAMLLTKKMSFAKHSATFSFFRKEFVNSQIIPAELGEVYKELFDNRQRGDYQDFIEFDKEVVKKWITGAKEFVDYATDWVENLKTNN